MKHITQPIHRFRQMAMAFAVFAVLTIPLLLAGLVQADDAPQLVIDQVEITTDQQFVRIHNVGSAAADLSTYQLVYFNSSNAPTKTFTFTGTVDPDGYYMLNDGDISVCYQMQINSTTLGFSTTSGSLQLWHFTNSTSQALESSVAWIKNSKTPAPSGVQMLPAAATAFLQRQWPANAWQSVQPKAGDPCNLVLSADSTTAAPDTTVHLTPGSVPPVNVITVAADYTAPKNVDMLAPVINELLPNPGSPKTDADDEFIELYNPNDTAFDLGGYKFLYGSSTPRSYTFPDGTSLAPLSYTAFLSSETSVALSNTSGQAWLTDANGTVLSQTDPYGTAKDDQSWALANGKWVWMSTPTPNAANNGTIVATSSGSKTSSTSVKSLVSGNVKSASTTTPSSGGSATDKEDAAPLHPLILAGIGLAAVGYAVYEYRHDISNKLFKFRRNLRNRQATRPKV